MAVKILVADPDESFCDRVQHLVTQAMGIVGVARSGEEAVRLATELRPDVVLMAIGLPGLDFIEATRRVKAEVPGVRVILVTGHDEEAYLSATGKSGADALLPKRQVRTELLSTIREVSERRRRRARVIDVRDWDGRERRRGSPQPDDFEDGHLAASGGRR